MNASKREWIKIPANRNNNPYSLFECPVCGYLMAWHERNCASHKRNHNHVLDICDTCGVWLNYMQREKLKRDAYKMADKAIRIEEKKFAYLLEWYSRYMRSLDSYPDIDKHPCFEDYMARWQKCEDPVERKKIWRGIIQILPQSYKQNRTVMMSYAALRNIVRQREGHKLVEWQQFIKWTSDLPESWMIL